MIFMMNPRSGQIKVFVEPKEAAAFMWGREGSEWFFWQPGKGIESCVDDHGDVKYLQERMEGKHQWWTIGGYDGNQHVCLKIQANSEEEARSKVPSWIHPDYVFAGKLDELSGDPESFELPEGAEWPEELVSDYDPDDDSGIAHDWD